MPPGYASDGHITVRTIPSVRMIDVKRRDYSALNGVLYFSPTHCTNSFAFSAKLRVATCDKCVVTSLSTKSGLWSELSFVSFNSDEPAYCALLQNGDKI